MNNLKTWPERIYLQCGDDASEPGDTPDYADCHDITWEAEKINACDVAYARADLAKYSQFGNGEPEFNQAEFDTIASELDKVTVDKCAYLTKKGMRFVGAVMMDADGKRATIDMGRVTWSDAPEPLQELADQAQALGMGYGSVPMPLELTQEMLDAWCDAVEENPYFNRRNKSRDDGLQWEVGQRMNEDWREVISDDQKILKRFKTSDECDDWHKLLVSRYAYKAMMAVVAKDNP